MNIISLEDEAFYALVAKLTAEIKQQFKAKERDKWIDGEEAMQMLRIISKTTLQKLRDQDKIRYYCRLNVQKAQCHHNKQFVCYLRIG